MPPCKVTIIALKTTQNYLLSQLLPPLLKPQTRVLVLQNGLNIEAYWVIGGLGFIGFNKIKPSHIHHIDDSKNRLGEYQDNYQLGGISERMIQITLDFEQAKISIELSEDLMLARWKKLVWNIPYNGLSVVLDARTDELMKNADTRLLAEALMQEVVAAAQGYNRLIPSSFVEMMLDHTDKMKPYLTSMKLDYDQHRPLELEAIVGNPLRAAIAAGISVPKIAMLYQQLKFLDGRNHTIFR